MLICEQMYQGGLGDPQSGVFLAGEVLRVLSVLWTLAFLQTPSVLR